MAGYTRTDTTDNIANNKIANADDLDNELNAIQSAFNALTGHTHDGAAGTGAPITKVGPAQDVVISATTVLPKTTATVDLGSSTFRFKDAWLSGTVTAPSFVGNLTGAVTGNAATATKLATSRTIWGQSFDGTANVTGNLSAVGNITGSTAVILTATGGTLGLAATGANTITATTNSLERMRIDASGKIGVGTTTIPADLTIGGASGADRSIQLGSVGITRGIIATDGANGILSIGVTNDSTAGTIVLKTGPSLTERVRVNEVGQVGVGVGLTSLPDTFSLLGPSGAGGNIGLTIGGGVGTAASPSVTNLNFRGYLNRRTAVIKSFDQTSNSNISGGLDFLVNSNMSADVPTSAMRIDGTGITGIGITPTARNNTTLQIKDGIGFPTTQVASSDANTLDDYEEGTFTPTIVGNTTAGTGTYNSNIGRYTKIGDRVFYEIVLDWTAHTGTGYMIIAGLPFTTLGTTPGTILPSNLTFSNSLAIYTISSTTTLLILSVGSGTSQATVNMDTSGTVFVSGMYRT